MTPFQMLNQKPAGFQQNGLNQATGQMGNATSGGGGGGGGIGGVSTGGLAANSPIAQWLQSQGLQPTLRDPSQYAAMTNAWNQLPGQQQLGMINNEGQGGAGLYNDLIMGGNSQGGMGQFQTQNNYNTAWGNGPNAANIAQYSGGAGGPASGGLGTMGQPMMAGANPATGTASSPAGPTQTNFVQPQTLGGMAGGSATATPAALSN